jgi:hypothetical protein
MVEAVCPVDGQGGAWENEGAFQAVLARLEGMDMDREVRLVPLVGSPA